MSRATTRRLSKAAQAAELEETKTKETLKTSSTAPSKVTQEEEEENDDGLVPIPPPPPTTKTLDRSDYIGSDGMVRIARPTTQDILFVPEPDNRRHQVDWPGNMFFQGLVRSRKSSFVNSTKRSEQTRIASEIVQAIRYANGRFLQKDGKDWCEMAEAAILIELGKLLRNDTYSSSSETEQQAHPELVQIHPDNKKDPYYKYNQFQSMYLTPVYGKQALLEQDDNNNNNTHEVRPTKRSKTEHHHHKSDDLSHWQHTTSERTKRTKKSIKDLPRGVTMRPSGKWQAQFYFAGQSRYIGVFANAQEAAHAYRAVWKLLERTRRQPGSIPHNAKDNKELFDKARLEAHHAVEKQRQIGFEEEYTEESEE